MPGCNSTSRWSKRLSVPQCWKNTRVPWPRARSRPERKFAGVFRGDRLEWPHTSGAPCLHKLLERCAPALQPQLHGFVVNLPSQDARVLGAGFVEEAGFLGP